MIPLSPPPVGRLIGFAMRSIEPGHAIFEMEADEHHHNPMGTMHGGVYCDEAGPGSKQDIGGLQNENRDH